MTAPDDAALDNMARRITLIRGEFEIIFDQLGRSHGSRIFKLTALLSPVDSPYLEALKTARDDGWFDDLTERLFLADAFRERDAAPDTQAFRVELQGMVQPRLGMFPVGAMTMGAITAAKRVCRIDVRSDPASGGTGFLIGPQAVLTARHVIEPLLDANGNPAAASAGKLGVVFDEVGQYHNRLACGVERDWLVDSSGCHMLERPDAPYRELIDADPEGFRDQLDYAIIRLDKPVGRERGFYRLDSSRQPCVETTGGQISLYQHPLRDQMHIGYGAGLELWPPAILTRLRHDANALDGTSGGLILDKSFEPVAMHQCTFRDACGVAVVNGAIPTACIAARTRSEMVELVIGLDPIWRIPTTGRPVIGRESFQSCVMKALSGSARIIAVRGPPDCGKTFSTTILRSLVDEGSNTILELSASTISVDARIFAGQLLEAMALADFPLPVGDPDTAREAWARDHLLPSLVQAMREYAGNRILWLVIDDLDSNSIAAGSTTSMIERLSSDIVAYPFLRLLLIGQRGQVPAAKPNETQYDDLSLPSQVEVADFFNRKYTAEGESKSLDQINAMAEFAMNVARASDLPLAEALAENLLAGIGALS